MRAYTQFPGRLPLFCMWTPVAYLLLSTAASLWRQDVLAEPYSLKPDVATFLDELKAMRNCGAAKGKMKVVCNGRNASFLQSPAMMDDWDTFKQNLCYCDGDCQLFRDCCADVADMKASASGGDVIKGISSEMWTCEPLAINRTDPKVSKVSIHMVSSCPASSTPRHQCMPTNPDVAVSSNYLLDMPVMDHRSGVWYKNVYCAHCHGVVKNLAPMNRTIMCEEGSDTETAKQMIGAGNATYLPGELKWKADGYTCVLVVQPTRWAKRPDGEPQLPGFYRPCVAAVNSCPPASLGSVAAARCPKFSYYLMKDMNTVYKNHYCALCNGVSPSDLLCWNPGDGFRSGVSNRFQPPSLSMLMDYKWDNNWREGKVVSAPAEVIYDPIQHQCVLLADSIYSYFVKDDYCVREVNNNTSSTSQNCEEISLNRGDYEIMANGSLLVFHNLKLEEYDIVTETYRPLDNGVVMVCATKRTGGDELIHSTRAMSILTAICLTISTVCLCLHIIAYSSIPKLKNLPGRNLLSLSWALLLGQFIFLFGVHPVFNIPNPACITIAVLIHYFYLAAFFWMSVMSYDIWRKFTTPTPESGHTSLHRKYSAYAWTSPAVIVLVSVVVDQIGAVHPYVRPNYGYRDTCWFGSPLGLGIFFAVPVIVILIVNAVLFATTVRKIMAQKKESGNYLRNQVRSELLEAKARQNSKTGRPSTVTRSPTSGARDTVRFYLYVKLFTIMGLTWVIGFAAVFSGVKSLWYPFIILNGLQGAFIFVMFDCKRSIGASMWDKTFGRRVATPAFLRAPTTSGASRSANSSMSTTRSRLTSSGVRSSRTSSVMDDGHEDSQALRQKVRVRMSDIVHEESEQDRPTTCEDTTKIDISSNG